MFYGKTSVWVKRYFLIETFYWSIKINFGEKKFVLRKKIWAKEIVFIQKNWGSKKNFGHFLGKRNGLGEKIFS